MNSRTTYGARVPGGRILLFAGLVVASLSGCNSQGLPRGGQSSGEKAVVAWLAALDAGDARRLVELSPPGLDAKQREELRRDLKARLGALRRLPNTPFALAPAKDGESHRQAKVTLARREGSADAGGTVELDLQLVRTGHKWYVEPPRYKEISSD